MTKTVPIHVKLTKGITDGKSEVDAQTPGTAYCENLDFVKDGEVRGRPSFVSYTGMGRRDFNSTAFPPVWAQNADAGTVSPDATGVSFPFNFSGMFKFRDTGGDRPGIAANGRAWTWEGDRWADRGYVGSARFDRLADLVQQKNMDVGNPGAVAYNYMSNGFGGNIVGISSPEVPGSPLLSGQSNTVESYQPGAGSYLYGNSCTAFDSLGVAYHCTVGHNGLVNNTLKLVVRVGDAQTLTSFTLATDCIQSVIPAIDAACCATDLSAGTVFGVPTIWVMYRSSAVAGQLNFQRVRVDTGAVVASSVFATGTTVLGFWLSVNSLNNRFVAVYTRAATPGVTCFAWNANTLVQDATTFSQFDGAAANNALGPVVVGFFNFQTVMTAFIAYLHTPGNAGIVPIGRYFPVPGAPSSVVYKTYGGAGTNADWLVYHQPILIRGPNRANSGGSSTDRIILGLNYAKNNNATGPSFPTSTYMALDITDLGKDAGESKAWGTRNPGLLAVGPIGGTHQLPCLASLKPVTAQVSALERSYRFSTWDFKTFNAAGGLDTALGINEVSLISPRFASIGGETILTGSVPHSLGKGGAFDTVYVMESPEFTATATGGGGLIVGSYSLQCVWKFVDDLGYTRRSAPSATVQTLSTSAGNQALTLVIQNNQMNNKEIGDVLLEVYMTDVNPTPTSQKLLQTTVHQAVGATTTVVLIGFTSTSEALYTNNGAILQNLPVSTEGGICVANQRAWVSDGRDVFASKKFKNEKSACVAWSDEGPLTIHLPSSSGRVLALENLEEKVIILCQNGIYYTMGDGPEDSGLGPDFLVPIQIADIGVSNECGSIATRHGVIFHAGNITTTDTGGGTTKTGTPGYGGLYLIQKNLELKKISKDIQEQLSTQSTAATFFSQFCELAYLPERDLLFVNRKGLLGEAFTPGSSNGVGSKLLVISMEDGEWSLWTNPNGDANSAVSPGSCIGMVGVKGALWGIYDRNGGSGHYAVGAHEGYPGTDAAYFSGDTTHPYTMLLRTNHMYSDGQSGTGWARVRGITVLGNKQTAGYTEKVDVVQDELNSLTQMTASIPAATPVTGGTWPVGRDAPEYRLSNQKCSQIQVQLQATPAVARWSALRLSTIPKNYKAPAGVRQ